ncbi:HNH endonuclease domain-containing protein [Myroides marinus]|uniref:HNH endonuclease domain-containing protein n=1 Tax=Myroides marinus TaxID=703342 RepID=UPI0025763E96|nr:HNH endonuclease domain-containing protein [Myroides marinus]MDM1377226.1 hypothetical protein [Myroides marinus]
MIHIKRDDSKASEYAKLIDTTKGKYVSISERLENWILKNPTNSNVGIVQDLKDRLHCILKGTPEELESLIKEYYKNGNQQKIYNNSLNNKGGLTEFGGVLLDLFNYKSFRKSAKAVWLSDSLNIKSCVTCNTQYTLKVNHIKNKRLLFHLDHFFPKSVYPYLSLSYYNLIPCCASCNMSKSNKVFQLNENIHPYLESFHDIAKFKLDEESLTEYLVDPNRNLDKLSYKVELRSSYLGSSLYEIKLENYLREFRICEQYEQFKDNVAEMCMKSRYYNIKRRKELRELFKESDIIISDELIGRFIVGNYHDEKDLLKRPLAKFMKDIGEDLGLI